MLIAATRVERRLKRNRKDREDGEERAEAALAQQPSCDSRMNFDRSWTTVIEMCRCGALSVGQHALNLFGDR
jgi:hypothetical protein